MKIELSNKIIKIKVLTVTEALKTLHFGLKEKIEFLEADEFEMETIMNVKVCKMILLELGDLCPDNEDVKILMKELFDEEVTLEELKEIDEKLIAAHEKQNEKQLG